MTRKSIEFKELDDSVTITLKTKSPEKYMLIDRETGNVFVAKETGEWELVRNGPIK